MNEPLDPISLEILWARAISIADEAAASIVRTSFSTVVRESNDYACVLMDARGRGFAANTLCIPSFAGILPKTTREFIRRVPLESWRPGDVMMTNDPWLATGHRLDTTVVTPIFWGTRLVGFAGSVAHKSDTGGVIRSADAREVFEEGIAIPPIHLYREGAINETLVELIKENVRVPGEYMGDLRAQVIANEVCVAKLPALLEEQGLESVEGLVDAIHMKSERAMRQSIAALPDGVYTHGIRTDGLEAELEINVRVTIDGDSLTVDYAGTSDQVKSGINCVYNYTNVYTAYPLKCVLDPFTPSNEGSYAPFNVVAPLGSVLNPTFPAPVAGRSLTGHFLTAAVFGALAKAMPDQVIAESGSPAPRIVISGERGSGDRYMAMLFFSGGMGAKRSKDGLSCTPFPTNAGLGSVEVMESVSPIRIWRRALRPDSGGAGTQRGGLGQEVEVEFTGDGSGQFALTLDRSKNVPQGLFGGAAGAGAQALLNGDLLPGKIRRPFNKGDRILLRTAGAGGYGPATARDAAALARDRTAGYVSRAGAEHYEASPEGDGETANG